jgi:hypothetical protein
MNEEGEEKEMRKGKRDERTVCIVQHKREGEDRWKGKTKNGSKERLKG